MQLLHVTYMKFKQFVRAKMILISHLVGRLIFILGVAIHQSVKMLISKWNSFDIDIM